MTPPADYRVPPAPPWAGDPITYGQAQDDWLAELHRLCADHGWHEWYTAMWGDRPPPVALDPYPERGDPAGRERWWQQWRDAYRLAGASATGIFEDPAASPPPERRDWSRPEIEDMVRDLLTAELPEAVALLLERRAGR